MSFRISNSKRFEVPISPESSPNSSPVPFYTSQKEEEPIDEFDEDISLDPHDEIFKKKTHPPVRMSAGRDSVERQEQLRDRVRRMTQERRQQEKNYKKQKKLEAKENKVKKAKQTYEEFRQKMIPNEPIIKIRKVQYFPKEGWKLV